jgi:hypothetical protein
MTKLNTISLYCMLLMPSILFELPGVGIVTATEAVAALYVFLSLAVRTRMSITPSFTLLALIIVFFIFNTLVLLLILPGFSITSATKSLARIILILLLIGFVATHVARVRDPNTVLSKLLRNVVIIHCAALLMDAIFPSPLYWTEVTKLGFGNDFPRPRGLFGEPSFFGYYVLLLFAGVVSLDNSAQRNSSAFLSVLVLISILASGSLSAAIGLLLIFVLMLRGPRKNIFSSRLVSRNFIYLLVFLACVPLLQTSFDYLGGRLGEIFVAGAVDLAGDSSTRTRILGSILVAQEIVTSHPILGVGLGGDNFLNLYEGSPSYVSLLSESDQACVAAQTCSASLGWGAFTFWSFLLVAGGLPVLTLFYGSLGIWMCKYKHSGVFIVVLIILSNFRAQVFDPVTWVLLALIFIVLGRENLEAKL